MEQLDSLMREMVRSGTVDVISKYGWQRRAFILNVLVYTILAVYFLILLNQGVPFILRLAVSVVHTSWIIFYSYWSLVRRRVRFI